MTEASVFIQLAEADGATFLQIRTTGLWGAVDREGMVIVPYVDGAMSKAEAARLYCEDKGLTPCTPDAILAQIVRDYRPYDTMPEFGEGFAGHQVRQRHENDDGVKGQAYDRGANAAMLYARAPAFLDAAPVKPNPAPGWLQRLLRTGRC
jgi:hypothetical protein